MRSLWHVVATEFTKADDLLQGYLAIVKNPDHYHNAQQRLADAHLKLEAIDKHLLGLVRQIRMKMTSTILRSV